MKACGEIYREDHGLDGDDKFNACSEHVCKYPWAFQFMSKDFRADEEAIEMILTRDGCAIINVVDPQLKHALMAISQNPSAMQYLPEEWKNDESIKRVTLIADSKERARQCRVIFESSMKKSARSGGFFSPSQASEIKQETPDADEDAVSVIAP